MPVEASQPPESAEGADAAPAPISIDTVREALRMAGVELDADADVESLVAGANANLKQYQHARKVRHR